jgi:Tfp pilus assembly protein PilF
MSLSDKFTRAMDLVEEGLFAQHTGDIEAAINCYKKSIQILPTAEAHTYLGWAYGKHNDCDAAIAECETAIRLDPEFGNPYNDIGVYLVRKGQPNEAIPWFEKAKRARRYEPRHFPYINLGHIYASKGMFLKAREEFAHALRLHPSDKTVEEALQEIQHHLN